MKQLNVTIAFEQEYEHTTIYGKLIKWWTKSNFYHTEVIIGNNWISSRINEGVHVKPLKPLKDKYLYKKLPPIELTDRQYNNLHTWLLEQENKDYDLLGIIWSQVFPFRYDDKNKWFCSEIVTKILQICGVPETFDLTPNLVSPGKLAKTFNME